MQNIYNKYYMRAIRRSVHQELFEQTLAKMKTKYFYQGLCAHFWKMEGIISEAKIDIVYHEQNTED